MSDVMIYALVDPRDNAIRYIGQTININGRYVQAAFSNSVASNPAVATWFTELRNIGLLPTIHLIEMVPRDLANARERYHIQEAIGNGLKLLNRSYNAEGKNQRVADNIPVKVTVTLPRWVDDILTETAAKEWRSVNQQILYLLEQHARNVIHDARSLGDYDYDDSD